MHDAGKDRQEQDSGWEGDQRSEFDHGEGYPNDECRPKSGEDKRTQKADENLSSFGPIDQTLIGMMTKYGPSSPPSSGTIRAGEPASPNSKITFSVATAASMSRQ